LSLTITVASESGAVRLVLALVWLGASPDPDVERLRSAVAAPLPVETFERFGEDPPDTAPTVTVVVGTLAVAVVPVVVAVTVGADSVVVVPSVVTEPEDVVAVTVVSVTETVPVLDTVVDVLALLTVVVVPGEADGAVTLVATQVVAPAASMTAVCPSGQVSARVVAGPAIDRATVNSATANVRIGVLISQRSLVVACGPERVRHFARSNGCPRRGSVTIR
jgi:hypothetical protein